MGKLLPLPTLTRLSRHAVLARCQAHIEAAWAHGLHLLLADVKACAREQPLLVQCALRIHDRREHGRAMLLALHSTAPGGRVESRPVLIAPEQQLVLLFSAEGVLDAAGVLVEADAATAPYIAWARDVASRDWY